MRLKSSEKERVTPTMTCCSLYELASEVSPAKQSQQKLAISPQQLGQLPVQNYDSLYELGPNQEVLNTRPWRNLPKYFTEVLISALALLKMSVHAKLGGSIEVMGMLTGKIVRNTIIVMDVYSLPVEGTETRVNAQNEAYEYMVQYLDLLKSVGREEHIVGWYHSHPGYGCWLSGIDVATQSLNQNFQDPYLAIVVDPILTVNQGKVEIGAFRTYPIGYVPAKKNDVTVEATHIKSKRKKHDFGIHAEQYYSLDIKLFKSSTDEPLIDAILNNSWVSNLLQATTSQIEYDKRLAIKVDALLSVKREKVPSYKRCLFKFATTFEEKLSKAGHGRHGPVEGTDTEDQMSIEGSVPPNYGSDDGDDDGDDDDDDGDDDDDDDDDIDIDKDDRNSSAMELQEDKNDKKRGLRTSSVDSKLSLYFEPSHSGTRKRFATGGNSALGNELNFKMQTAQSEIKRQLRNVLKVGHSELIQMMANQTRRKVFGGFDTKD